MIAPVALFGVQLLYHSLALTVAVPERSASVLGSILVTILAVSILIALSVMVSIRTVVNAFSDAVPIAVSILCCQGRSRQKASYYQSRQYSYVFHVY